MTDTKKDKKDNPEMAERYVFPEDSTRELLERLVTTPEARLRVLITAAGNCYLRVVGPGATKMTNDDPPDINNAHRCPPFVDCPD